MSTFKVPITTIREINPHPSADKLEIAKCYDYDVIIPKDIYEVGQIVVYVPVGSILSDELESLLFPEDSKIKLTKNRIRAIKIRGVVSQGMILDPEVFPKLKSKIEMNLQYGDTSFLETDAAEILGITKWMPPVADMPNLMNTSQVKNILKNLDFKQYTDVEHGKYYDRQVMTTGEEVIVTQKLHGTSARYGYFKRPVRSFMDKVKDYLGFLPAYEFCWGSRRCQISSRPDKKHVGFKSEEQGVDFGDVYTKITEQYNLKKLLPAGYAVYGEIVGWGIQKGYLYNCGKDKHAFYVYDVMKDGKYLNYDDALAFCQKTGLVHVPLLYRGPYIMDNLLPLLKTNVISKEVNEGIVLKPVEDRSSPVMGRVLLKYINEDYLMRDNTEFQ